MSSRNGCASGSGFRILIVDDSDVQRLILRHMLRDAGAEIGEAASGGAAVETCAAWQPHLVLMDLSMAGMDGAEAVRRIRAHHAGGPAPVIAAMTALPAAQMRRATLALDIAETLPKPVERQALLALVARVQAALEDAA